MFEPVIVDPTTVITLRSTLCTRIQAGYQDDERQRYSSEGQDSPEYIWVHQAERGDPHRLQSALCRSHTDAQWDTECQDAIFGRLLGYETRLLMALVS